MKAEQILEKIVSIPSTFPNESKLAEWIENYLEERGFRTERQKVETEDRWNLFAERGTEGKMIAFYGHMDTVPKYGDWETDPYILTEKDDKLFGLGACDMKAGIAAILSMVNKIDKKRKIKLFFSVDEEYISKGAWEAMKNKLEWFEDTSVLIVAEPGVSDKYIGGTNVIVLGRRGRIVYSIKVKGKSAHGAMPDKGISAITEAAKIAIAVENEILPSNESLGRSTAFIKKFEGKTTSLSIPDEAYLEVDRHMVIPEKVETARKDLENLISNLKKEGKLHKETETEVAIKKRVTPYLEPYLTDKNNDTVKKILSIMKSFHDEEPRINYGLSVADENVFANNIKAPVVTIGPLGGNEHSANEWVSKKSLEKLSELFYTIINKI